MGNGEFRDADVAPGMKTLLLPQDMPQEIKALVCSTCTSEVPVNETLVSQSLCSLGDQEPEASSAVEASARRIVEPLWQELITCIEAAVLRGCGMKFPKYDRTAMKKDADILEAKDLHEKRLLFLKEFPKTTDGPGLNGNEMSLKMTFWTDWLPTTPCNSFLRTYMTSW